MFNVETTSLLSQVAKQKNALNYPIHANFMCNFCPQKWAVSKICLLCPELEKTSIQQGKLDIPRL